MDPSRGPTVGRDWVVVHDSVEPPPRRSEVISAESTVGHLISDQKERLGVGVEE